MIELTPYIPVALQLIILAGAIYAARSARPKQVAEAKQAEAQAALALVNGFAALVAAQQRELGEKEAELREEKRRAGIVPTLARRIDELELELKQARAMLGELEHDT